jgi:type II secretory pathway component PulJ
LIRACIRFDVNERRQGFTLIEVVGAFFMMVVILVFITGMFIENGRQRSAATELIRVQLSANGTLDLIANDLESTVFVARGGNGDSDPGGHPWRILADSGGELGAVAIRFVTQNAPQSNSAENASSWVEVAYFLEEDEMGQQVLWRWRSARPPSETPDGYPDSSDAGSVRIAVGVSDFGVRLRDFEGNWLDEWDSNFLPSDQAVPEAAEISLALFRAARRGESSDGEIEIPGELHVRRVSIVMRPIDVEALLEFGKTGEDDDPNCFTIDDCIGGDGGDWYESELDSACGDYPELCTFLGNSGSCWDDLEREFAPAAANAPSSCRS